MQSRAERVRKQLMHNVMLFTKSIYHFLDKKELLIEACLKLATLQIKMYAYCTYLRLYTYAWYRSNLFLDFDSNANVNLCSACSLDFRF
jgi:hypothetical protein